MEFNATFLVSIISFIVFVSIMNWIFYKPLQTIVEKRQSFIDETNEDAKLHKEKADELLKDKAKKIETTKHDAKKIIIEKSDEVKNKKNVLTSKAKEKSTQKIEMAKDELQKSKDEAQVVLSEEVKDLAQVISSKILGKV